MLFVGVFIFDCKIFVHWSIAMCEAKLCGIAIDQSLFYIDLTVHYTQNFENLT